MKMILPTDAWGTASVVALTIAAYLLAARPFVEARTESERLADAVVQRGQDLMTAERRVGILEAQQSRLRAEAALTLELQPVAELNERLGAIGALAGAHGIEIVELRRVSEQAEADYHTVALRLAGEGTFRNLVAFVHQLHSSEPLVAVETLDVSGNPRSTGSLVRITLDLLWHAAPVGNNVAQVGLDDA